MRLWTPIALLTVGLSVAQADSRVVCRALNATPEAATQLIGNPGIEARDGDQSEGWVGWERGYVLDGQVRRSGALSARCVNAAGEHRGLTYTVVLNQTEPMPILAECWSRAENVTGGYDQDYSLYLDLEYMDGTPLWGQVAPFKPGTHDWQLKRVTVVPSKPIKSVSVHAIFRIHAGTAWFDDFGFWELSLPQGAGQFDGAPVEAARPQEPTYAAPLPGLPPIALSLRDAGARSDLRQPETAWVPQGEGVSRLTASDEELGLELVATAQRLGGALRVDGVVSDLRGTDRAVSVYCATPLPGEGWSWHEDQRTARVMAPQTAYRDCITAGAGANGLASRFPLACVTNRDQGLAIGAPLDVPRICRFACEPYWDELYGVVDLGLSPDTRKFPSQASFSFVLYPTDPEWGYRAALKRYYELFPGCFTKRNDKEGIWMPFVDISTVAGFQDFGFQFQEGAPNVAFDETQGIYSFPYVEPMSHWLSMPKDMERTNERAMELIRQQAAEGNRQSQATLNCVNFDPDDQWIGGITTAPWCDGALYLLSPSPYIRADDPQAATKFRNDFAGLEAFMAQPAAAIGEWYAYGVGFQGAQGEGRDGSDAVRVTRAQGGPDGGANQRVVLNQAEARPIITRLWTRTDGVSGTPDNNYALYVDLVYSDGTPGFGFVVEAPVAGTDWQLLEQRIVPLKPVASLAFHGLLRAPHEGTVWFDDAFCAEEGSDRNLLANGGFETHAPRLTEPPFVDGTYFDSFEMASTMLNYRREHFTDADTPLVYDREGRLCQLTIFSTTEYVREVARRMHAEGRMTFANATPWNFAWGAPWLDVMGTETNWAPGATFTQEDGWSGGETYTPESDSIMLYRRAVCYQRPYLLLQNTVFDVFKPEWVELYMKRCLAYAVFPSFFSHNAADAVYWNRPNLYDRDRPLFRKYIPVIQTLSAAGWEPVTEARSSAPRVYVERFGDPGETVYLTVFNDTGAAATATVTVDLTRLLPGFTEDQVTELVSGEALQVTREGSELRIPVSLDSEDVKVLVLR